MHFSWKILFFFIMIAMSVVIIHSSYGYINNANQNSFGTDKLACSWGTLDVGEDYGEFGGSVITIDNSTLTKYPDLQDALNGFDKEASKPREDFPSMTVVVPEYRKTISGDVTAVMLQDHKLGFIYPNTCGDRKSCEYTLLKRGDREYLVYIFFADCTSKNYFSPRQQIANGVLPEKVVCSDGLVLIQKLSTNSSACVKPQTAQKLVERGWGTIQTSVTKETQKTQSTLQNPVQIVSVKTIPTNPKIGDKVVFDLTVQNKANYPIYYALSCGTPQYYVSITPADDIQISPSIPCACLAGPPVKQLNSNDTIHLVYPVSCGSTGTISKLGVITVKSTFLWGTTSQNPQTNVTSMTSTFNLIAKEEDGTLTNPVIISKSNATKILSISMSPNPLKVGDTPYFTLAYQNISDKPIYHMEGCRAYSLSYTLSPETNLQQIPRVGPLPSCMDYESLIQPNQVITDNAVPILNVVGFKIIKAGTLNVTMALNLRNLSGDGFTNYIQFQINATQ